MAPIVLAAALPTLAPVLLLMGLVADMLPASAWLYPLDVSLMDGKPRSATGSLVSKLLLALCLAIWSEWEWLPGRF